jgi:hypothetical protein
VAVPQDVSRHSGLLWAGLTLCTIGALAATHLAPEVAQLLVTVVGTAPAQSALTFEQVFGDRALGGGETVGVLLCVVGALVLGLGAVRRLRA